MTYVSLVIPFLLVLALVPVLKMLAARVGLLDHPGGRKQHHGAVPLVGGWAVFIATAVSIATIGLSPAVPRELAAGCLAMVVIGTLDDRWPMSSLLRFGAQAFIIWWVATRTGAVLTDLGPLVSSQVILLGSWAVPFTVFGYLGVLNAVNLTDGADGLAGGIAVTALASFLAVFIMVRASGAWPPGLENPSLPLIVLMGALFGFLWFNLRTPWRPRAVIFMGDAGSLLLGFVLAWVAIFACSKLGSAKLSPVSALFILIVPLFDTVSCMMRRVLQGRSPMSADRNHTHHLLMAWGLTPGQTVTTLIIVNALGGVVGVMGWVKRVPESLMFGGFLAAFSVYALVSLAAWNRIEGRAAANARALPAGHEGIADGRARIN